MTINTLQVDAYYIQNGVRYRVKRVIQNGERVLGFTGVDQRKARVLFESTIDGSAIVNFVVDSTVNTPVWDADTVNEVVNNAIEFSGSGDGIKHTVDVYPDSVESCTMQSAGITKFESGIMPKVKTALFFNNKIPQLILVGWESLEELQVHGMPDLVDLNIIGCTSLKNLRCFSTSIGELNLPNSPLVLVSAGSAKLTNVSFDKAIPSNLVLNNNHLSTATVNRILTTINASSAPSGSLSLQLQTDHTNGEPIGTIDSGTPEEVLLKSLEAKGWTINYTGTA